MTRLDRLLAISIKLMARKHTSTKTLQAFLKAVRTEKLKIYNITGL